MSTANDIHRIEVSMAEAKEVMAMRDAINKLRDDPLFQKVILEGYFKDEASRITLLRGDMHMQAPEDQAFLNHQLLEKKGLIVNSVMDTIEIEYAVGKGISQLTLDVAELNEFDVLHVSDIVAPEGVKIVSNMESVVVSIATPRDEVEETDEEVEEVLEVESIKQSNE